MNFTNPTIWNPFAQSFSVASLGTVASVYVMNQEKQTNQHVIAVTAIFLATIVCIARIHDRITSGTAIRALSVITVGSALASTTEQARTGKVCSRYLRFSDWTKQQVARFFELEYVTRFASFFQKEQKRVDTTTPSDTLPPVKNPAPELPQEIEASSVGAES